MSTGKTTVKKPAASAGSVAYFTPLRIVAIFVTLTETVLGVALTQVQGGVQVALTVFVIFFAISVATGFFLILWYRPYVFYSPAEFGQTDPREFIEAMRPPLPERVVEQIRLVENVEEKPTDRTPQFELIDSLIDEAARQHVILMHENSLELPFDRYTEFGHSYETGSKTWGSRGTLNGLELGKKLNGTGLLEANLNPPSVRLTQMGHEFGRWLIETGRKADFMKTPYGGWGTPTEMPGGPVHPVNADGPRPRDSTMEEILNAFKPAMPSGANTQPATDKT